MAGEQVLMYEVVERKFAGDTVELTFIRDGQKMSEQVTLVPSNSAEMYSIAYDVKPRYFFTGAFLFQPLDINLYRTYQLSSPTVRTLYKDYIDKGIFKTREDLVVLTNIYEDQLTSNLSGFKGQVVHSVNDVEVKGLQHLHDMMTADELPEYLVIKFDGSKKPLVIKSADLAAAEKRMQSRLGISDTANL